MTERGALTGADRIHSVDPSPTPGRVPLRARVTARLRATRYDRMLAVGVPARPGTPLAAHHARLTSTAERGAVAHSLGLVLEQAGSSTSSPTRIPLNRNGIRETTDMISRMVLRLRGPEPVCVRGMARLRLLLSDGAGPLYRSGRGDLRGRLGAALAEL